MQVTLAIGAELASELKPYEDHLSEILKLGIREWQARDESGYRGLNDVLKSLVALPDPADVLKLRPAAPLQKRLDELMEKSRVSILSNDEQREWDQFQYIEHLVRMAKANAVRKLKKESP